MLDLSVILLALSCGHLKIYAIDIGDLFWEINLSLTAMGDIWLSTAHFTPCISRPYF
jgi:hypothetical protein